MVDNTGTLLASAENHRASYATHKAFVSKHGHHINGIENFWNQSKRVLFLFLKECEFHFNYGTPKQLTHFTQIVG
jgi:transposase